MAKTGARREIEGMSTKRAPLARGTYPWLVYKHGKKNQGQTFCSTLESGGVYAEISRKYIRELRNKIIVACSYGWVVLFDGGHNFSLWNPVTSESIDLPPLKLKPNQEMHYCLLTASPHHTDCKILLFGGNFYSLIFCQLCNKQWTEIGYYNQMRFILKQGDEFFLRKPIICNGKIYAISSRNLKLFLIELDGSNELTISLQTELPWPQHTQSSQFDTYLVESLGEIYYIWINLGGLRDKQVLRVEVFKLDLSTVTWENMTSAKGRVFFLGYNYTISCPVHAFASDVEGSRIYFTMEEDTSMYSYNMEDESVLVSLPCLDLPTPCHGSYWIMPNSSLLNEEVEEKEEKNVLTIEREIIEKIEEEAKEPENINLQDLPWLALNGIARNLTLVDYMNFRAVSKLCRSAAPPIRWKTEFAGLKAHLLSPWFIFPEKNKGVYHVVDSRLNNRCFLTIPDLLQDTIIRYSKDGWLLMSKDSSVKLFNPFTKDIIQLPDIDDNMDFADTSFILACSPSSPDCYVLGISLRRTHVVILIIHPGEEEWDYSALEIEKPLDQTYNSGVFCRGDFYFLNQNSMLEVVKIEDDDQVGWESFDMPQAPCIAFHENYLVECGGELLAIFIGKQGKWVKIFKLNFLELVWEKVTSLKNYALYLSRSSSFSAMVNTPEMANRIYFPRFHNQGGMVFYSLVTGKFHALGTEYSSMNNYYNTALQLDCAWIEPAWC